MWVILRQVWEANKQCNLPSDLESIATGTRPPKVLMQ